MVCAINKRDSNITGLSYAEEACLKQLPSELDPSDEAYSEDVTWYGLEPNSYNDFGGNLSTTARSPIDPSRQNKKGTVVDLDASGGFNHDVISDRNLTRLLQGFFFADARQKASTLPFNGAAIAVSSVSSTEYVIASGGAAFNRAGLLVLATGFGDPANNGLKTVTAADATGIEVAGLVAEASPPAGAQLEIVGYQFGSAAAGITRTGNRLTLTDTGNALASLGLTPGEWIFIGGDTPTSNAFANNRGFARLETIAAGSATLSEATFDGATETSTGKTIRIFFGTVIRNEKTPALIKRRSYQFERTLGEGETDTQAEYITGAVPNELTLNIPGADKLNVDMSFVACDNYYRSGDEDDTIKTADANASFVPSIGADAFNSTSDVYRMKMSINDPTSSNPAPLFGFVTEGGISISNGVTPNKAVGVLGAFDTSLGNFVVGGSLTAYFTTVAAVRAVRSNADVGFNVIFAKQNSGFIFDIPLLGLGGGRANVTKDQPIMVPLEPAGAENANGYTMLYNFFPYLPDVAMPQ